MSEKKEVNAFYESILWRFRHNKNWVACIVGPVGSGKSWAALRLCSDLDPTFDKSRICFYPSEFYKLVGDRIDDKIGPGSFILLDEAAVSLDADKHGSEETIARMKYMLQTFRVHNLGVVMTFPGTIGFVNKKIRQMFNTFFVIRGIDYKNCVSTARVTNLQTNEFSGKIYRHTPEIDDKSNMSCFQFTKPPKSLLAEYELMKHEYTKKMNRKLIEEERKREAGSEYDYYISVIRKDPEKYKNEGRFNYAKIMALLDLNYQKACAVSAVLNDKSRGDFGGK